MVMKVPMKVPDLRQGSLERNFHETFMDPTFMKLSWWVGAVGFMKFCGNYGL
jgi:hypothetical protein